jgi:hypothetical protein
MGEICIRNGWIVRCRLIGYGVSVYAIQLVLVVESKDVCKETVVGRCIFGPRIGGVLNIAC